MLRDGASVRCMRLAQMRSGIVDRDVDLVRGKRIEQHVGSQARPALGGQAGRLQALLDQGGEDVLLGESLCADDIVRLRPREAGEQRSEYQRDETRDA